MADVNKDKDILAGTKELTLDDLNEIFKADERYDKDEIKIEYTEILKKPEDKNSSDTESNEKSGGHSEKTKDGDKYSRIVQNKSYEPESPEASVNWKGAEIEESFWKDKYSGFFFRLFSKMNRVGLLALLVAVVLVLVSGGVTLYNYFTANSVPEIDHILAMDEEDLCKELGLKLEKSVYYTKIAPAITDSPVYAKADKGIAAVYIDEKMEGVYFDTKEYRAFGYRVGERADSTFSALEYEYTDVYVDTKRQRSVERNLHYLYNKKKGDCVVIVIDDKMYVKEIGYFHNYRKLLERLF